MISRLRIATWNLARPGPTGAERNAAIIAKMGESNADIWVLTETGGPRLLHRPYLPQ